MRLTMTWSLGLVLALAAMAHAQSETPNNPTQFTDRANQTYFLANLYPDINSTFVYSNNHDGESGLNLAPVDEAARVHLKMPKGQGLIVTSVAPQGAAAQAGVCQNDILLTLDDAPLAKGEDLEGKLKAAGDKTLNLVLLHQGQKKILQVQPKLKVTFGPPPPAPPEFWIGVSVTPLEPALRAQLQIPANQGLIATSVMDDSPAAKAGLKVNDILLSINGKGLLEQTELATLVQKNGEKPIVVEIVREGSRQTIVVTPERRKSPHLLTARVQQAGNWNVVYPGAVVQGNTGGWIAFPEWNSDLTLQAVRSFDTWSAQPQTDPRANRLDTMANEIKELRKAVEELSKAIKDRK